MAKQRLLRLGVILYGFHLTFQDVARVGMAGVVIDVLVICSTFFMAWWLGTRVFRMERNTALLIGVGSSICGAAAVMATEPVVRGRAEQVTVAVSTVLVFGTLATLLYPALYQLNQHWGWLPVSAQAFGIFTGSTVHEVAQVVAAAHSISPETADTAVIAKMVRVMLLAPFLVLLSISLARTHRVSSGDHQARRRITVPWFAIGFAAVTLLHSTVALPSGVVEWLLGFDTLLLAMAMAALGLTTHIAAVRRAGIKPMLFAALLFLWLVMGGALINRLIMHALA